MKKLSIILLMSIAAIFSGCSDQVDEPTPTDVRDQIVGTYSAKVSYYNASGLIDTETLTLKAEKSTTNSESINFYEGSDIYFRAVKIKAAGNGAAFDIEEQTEVFDGDTYNFRPYAYFTLEGTKYSGVFESSTNRIQFAYQLYINGTYELYAVYELNKV